MFAAAPASPGPTHLPERGESSGAHEKETIGSTSPAARVAARGGRAGKVPTTRECARRRSRRRRRGSRSGGGVKRIKSRAANAGPARGFRQERHGRWRCRCCRHAEKHDHCCRRKPWCWCAATATHRGGAQRQGSAARRARARGGGAASTCVGARAANPTCAPARRARRARGELRCGSAQPHGEASHRADGRFKVRYAPRGGGGERSRPKTVVR